MDLKVDIRKTAGSFILQSSFEIKSGERFALLGSSGAGKSMTLRCIAGIEKPDSGKILLGDKILFDSDKGICLPPQKRNVGYLFQDPALFPNMTVKENISSVCHDSDYTNELLDRFELLELSSLYPSDLSGGQKQRLAIARMLSTRPDVLLFDEPFSALDNYLHMRIEQQIMDITDKFEGPSVLVSHDRNEVYRMSDRICVIDEGKTFPSQDKEDFFEHPQNVISARLTGCKNISAIDDNCNALDWGIKLFVDTDELTQDIKFVGYRAHFFEVAQDEGDNVFDAVIERVIEDTFSVTVIFSQYGNESMSPDSHLTWIVNKDKWHDIDAGVNSRIKLKLDPHRLLFMKG